MACNGTCGWQVCNNSCASSCSNSGSNAAPNPRFRDTSRGCHCGTNCANACSSCWGSCSGSCEGSSTSVTSSNKTCSSCAYTCEVGCKTTCESGCSGSCETTCSGKCTASCSSECNYGCISSVGMAAYRKLKLTEYINSDNIKIIYNFINNELIRLEKEPIELNEDLFNREKYALKDTMEAILKVLNTVKIDKSNDNTLEEETKYLFDKVLTIDGLQLNRDESIGQIPADNEIYINTILGQEIINRAKILFNVKILNE